jgi:hypothetical protein
VHAVRFALGIVLLVLLAGSTVQGTPDPKESAQAMTVTIVFDRSTYVSGDTVSASAIVYRTPAPTNYTYSWTVRGLVVVFNTTSNTTAAFAFPIPLNYSDPILTFNIVVDDLQGLTVETERSVVVSLGVMALRLDRAEFAPGDTITATYSVRSHVIVNPTYDYQVDDVAATIVLSGNTNDTSFSFRTPVPASRTYAFLVTAREGDNRTQGRISIAQVAGIDLAIGLDKGAYSPGETVRAHLSLTPRGMTSLPSQFEWYLNLGSPFGQTTFATAITTVPEVDLTLTLPAGVATGDILVFAHELRTNAVGYVTLHVGATSPLWTTELGGIPLFAVLLGLLFLLVLVAVLGLWRRMSGGLVPAGVRPSEIAAAPTGLPVPPPPPDAPAWTPSVAPMSIACQHCGKPIELSTSKRPIEVMCPACGETQLIT